MAKRNEAAGEATDANEQVVETAEATAEAKRAKVSNRVWLKGSEETKDPREADGLRITVIDGGTFEGRVSDYDAGVQNALALFGLNIVLTNTMGGQKGEEAFESIMSRHETLAAGEWTSRKGAEGPRISLLAQAVVAAYAKTGVEKTIESVTAALIAGGEEARKKTAANAAVKAEYDRLRAEAAAARAAKSAEKAGSGSLDDLGF